MPMKPSTMNGLTLEGWYKAAHEWEQRCRELESRLEALHDHYTATGLLHAQVANFLRNIKPALGDGYSGKALAEKAELLAKDLEGP